AAWHGPPRLNGLQAAAHFSSASDGRDRPSRASRPGSSNSNNNSKSSSSELASENRKKTAFRELQGELKMLLGNPDLARKIASVGVDSSIIKSGLVRFRNALLADELPGLPLSDVISNFVDSPKISHIIMPALYAFLQREYPNETSNLTLLINSSDLRAPAEWYPQARAIKRKIVMHIGPTNSGKTYAAIQRFKQSTTGIYCGRCGCLRMSDNVTKWSCTVEMALIGRHFDVAVVDEIQMIGDAQRGWAWTQAVLALQADEIHLCGEGTAVEVIRRLCRFTGDELVVNEYERLTSLTIANKSLDGQLSNVQPGDALIAFSRKTVHKVKAQLETVTKMRAAVIYGSLPPESRAEQAKAFNDPNSKYSVLVASDAIGMGLNLNIRRIVFVAMDKFNGSDMVPLTISQAKQIAGRAGRFGTQWENGFVTTLNPWDLKQLHAQMKMNAPRIMAAGVLPTFEQIERFAVMLPNDTLAQLLTKFEDLAQFDGSFFLCNLDGLREIAKTIQPLPMSLRDRFYFIQAPCNVDDPFSKDIMLKYARAHSRGATLELSDAFTLDDFDDTRAALAGKKLKDLEIRHRCIILYLWLSMRFPETFTEREQAVAMKEECEGLISKCLANLRAPSNARSSHGKKKHAHAYQPSHDADGREMQVRGQTGDRARPHAKAFEQRKPRDVLERALFSVDADASPSADWSVGGDGHAKIKAKTHKQRVSRAVRLTGDGRGGGGGERGDGGDGGDWQEEAVHEFVIPAGKRRFEADGGRQAKPE
ncbi:hypothetical protein BC831DRAFT_470837, partial [Entophlyctis helioformis]